MDLFKEIYQWPDQYASILGGYEQLEQLTRLLLVDGTTIVSSFYFPYLTFFLHIYHFLFVHM